MLPDLAGIEPAASWSSVGQATHWGRPIFKEGSQVLQAKQDIVVE